jgi:hypothetical protein
MTPQLLDADKCGSALELRLNPIFSPPTIECRTGNPLIRQWVFASFAFWRRLVQGLRPNDLMPFT